MFEEYLQDMESNKWVNNETLEDWTKTISNCNDGFDIMAKQNVTVALFKTYVDYLKAEGNTLTQTKDIIESTLNKSIEKYNVGSKDMVNDIFKYVNDVYKPATMYSTLMKHLGLISRKNKFNDKPITVALENAYNERYVDAANTYCTALFNRYKDKLMSVFPDKFKEKLK